MMHQTEYCNIVLISIIKTLNRQIRVNMRNLRSMRLRCLGRCGEHLEAQIVGAIGGREDSSMVGKSRPTCLVINEATKARTKGLPCDGEEES